MRSVVIFVLFNLLIFFGGSGDPVVGQQQDLSWMQKVDSWVLETSSGGAETEFLIFLAVQADLSHASSLPSKIEKGIFVFQELRATAAATQPPVILELEAAGVEHKPFWVANMIWVKGGLQAIETVARRSDIAHVYANPQVRLEKPPQTAITQEVGRTAGIEWNISKVNAPQVWANGYTGRGVVIGGQDTGYVWDHPGLVNQYRGWNGVAADHNYSWHNAIAGESGVEPFDDHGHGTHTMGTMVGNDLSSSDPSWPAGAANAVGMAPGARWIGCRNMDAGVGSPATYINCYQWFIAPTDLNDQNPNPALAPDVINNSWACPASEGCTDPTVLLTVVQNVRAAGIITVHSAGNSGPSCSTVDTPAAIYDESFSVGATDSSDNVASFSSRGPVTVDSSGRMKPDICAPGVSVRSCWPGGGYSSLGGTSMAGPHVAGLAALMLSANYGLTGNVTAIEEAIAQTAVPRTSSQGCGGDSPSSVPNNTYGWGRIDSAAAVTKFIFSTYQIIDGHDFDGNGTSDISTWRPPNGMWYIKNISFQQWGMSGDIPVNGYYNSDNIADLAVWRPADGMWYIKNVSSDQWGMTGDIPVPGDYDGDNLTDIAIWRPSQGMWYIKDIGAHQWGGSGDIPVPGDYDGDSITEIAVWRPSQGMWYIKDIGAYQWGGPGDIPVPGDYNGDETTEIAVWRPSDGVWYIKDIGAYQWGAAGDLPVPGKYDANTSTDIAVWRPSIGVWYIKNIASYQWGQAGDIPLVR